MSRLQGLPVLAEFHRLVRGAKNSEMDGDLSGAPSAEDLSRAEMQVRFEATRRSELQAPAPDAPRAVPDGDLEAEFSMLRMHVNRLADALTKADVLGQERTSRGKLGQAYNEAVSLASFWAWHVEVDAWPFPSAVEAAGRAKRAARAAARLNKAVRQASRPIRGKDGMQAH